MNNWNFFENVLGGWKIKILLSIELGGWKIDFSLNNALGGWKIKKNWLQRVFFEPIKIYLTWHFELINGIFHIKSRYHYAQKVVSWVRDFKAEGEFVLCVGIWNVNLQFCPKWLSEGFKKSKLSCSIQIDSQHTVNKLKFPFIWDPWTAIWFKIGGFFNF